METIAWIGISQSIFAAILIGTKTDKTVSDRILSAWLSLLAIEFFTCILDYNIHGQPLLSSSFLLFNPALFLYVKSLTNPKFKLKYSQLFHLIPYILLESISYFSKDLVSLTLILETDKYYIYRIIFGFISMASWILYNSISYILVDKHRKNLVNEFSNIEKNKKLGWILFIVIFYAIYSFSVFFILVYSIVYKINFPLSDIFSISVLLALIYILGYYGLMQKKIFIPVSNQDEIIEQQKYKSSSLSDDKKNQIKNQIINYFDSQKPYLNSDFNMEFLSEKLEIPKHQITEVLNTVIRKKFFSFVNSYRVNDVKKMLSENSNPYSIEAIGYECGFNSKSSFFTVFKNITGQTPLQYKNSL